MKDSVRKALINQINMEFNAGYLYMIMSVCAENKGFYGFSKLLKHASNEEFEHGNLIIEFLGEGATFLDIKAPEKQHWIDVKEMLEDALLLELSVKKHLSDIYGLSINERDIKTAQFLKKLTMNQMDEIKELKGIITKVKKSDFAQLSELDSEYMETLDEVDEDPIEISFSKNKGIDVRSVLMYRGLNYPRRWVL